MASLPIPSPEAQAQSAQLADLIRAKIIQAGGWISFADFMHMALYTPGLGYYAGGAKKFGQGGDFVTAPEISPLFAQTLARQYAQLQAAWIQGESNSCSEFERGCPGALASGADVLGFNILELGAGTGKLAKDLLLELQVLDALPSQYFIMEVSDYLRQIQHETCERELPVELFEKLVWLETLPKNFNGLILGNEVLDAIPVHILHKRPEGWRERGVAFVDDFVWQDAELSVPNLAENLSEDLPIDYLTEVCPAASALVYSLADSLESGAILLVDYGFSAREYYHPQRNQGTLMCHYQQLAHDNPLVSVGLQDITAHVNFTQISMLCEPISMRVAGYANQAQFLINCGILDILAQHSPDSPQFMQLAAAAQKYLSPAEMGELFKVIAFTKNIELDLIGFRSGDKTHTL
jgi:SAM-dependent MidA family methyltransferase